MAGDGADRAAAPGAGRWPRLARRRHLPWYDPSPTKGAAPTGQVGGQDWTAGPQVHLLGLLADGLSRVQRNSYQIARAGKVAVVGCGSPLVLVVVGSYYLARSVRPRAV